MRESPRSGDRSGRRSGPTCREGTPYRLSPSASPARAPSPPDLIDLAADFCRGSGRNAWHDLVEDLELPQPLALAQPPDPLAEVVDGFAHDGTLRFGQPLGSLPETSDRVVVKCKGDFDCYHTITILPYHQYYSDLAR